MRYRIVLVVAGAISAGGAAIAQNPPALRRIDASETPIVKSLKPDDQHVLLTCIRIGDPVDIGRRSFIAALVDFNPVIFIGRVVRKEPAFIDLWNAGGRLFTVVPMSEANWVGSHLTVQIERVIRTSVELPLVQGRRFTFVEDYDGSATINGVRVDAEDPRLWPIVADKRYLVTGEVKPLGRQNTRVFVPSGMWLEPFRHVAERQVDETLPTFELDVPRTIGDTTLRTVTDGLEREVTRQKAAKR